MGLWAMLLAYAATCDAAASSWLEPVGASETWNQNGGEGLKQERERAGCNGMKMCWEKNWTRRLRDTTSPNGVA